MHVSSEIAALLREWAQLRAEMERLHCQFKALHDQSVKARLKLAETRAGSLLHEIQARLKAKNSPPPKPNRPKLHGFPSFDPLRPNRYPGCGVGGMSSTEKNLWRTFSHGRAFGFIHSEMYSEE